MKKLIPLLLLGAVLALVLALVTSGGSSTPTYDPIAEQAKLYDLQARQSLDASTITSRKLAADLWNLLPPLLLAGALSALLYTFVFDRAEKRRRYAPDANGLYEVPDWRTVKHELGEHIAAAVVMNLTGGSMQASIARATAPAVLTSQVAKSLPAPDASDPVPLASLPTAPNWADLRAGGFTPTTGRMLLGYGQAGPVYGGIDALLSTAIAGRPGQGKTTALRFVYAQTVLAGGQVIVMDPHGSIVDALGEGQALWTASTQAELEDGAGWLQEELERRGSAWKSGQRNFTPLLVLCDEWPVISMQSKAAVDAAGRVILEARKWGAYALISGQGLPAGKFSGGSLVRDALSSRFIFRTTPAQARMAGLDTETARLVDTLDVGRCILDGPVEPQIVAIPNTTALDLSSLARTGATSPTEQAATISKPEINFERISASESAETASERVSDEPVSTLETAVIITKLKAAGLSKATIIEALWGARPGGSKTYQQASRLYDQLSGGAA